MDEDINFFFSHSVEQVLDFIEPDDFLTWPAPSATQSTAEPFVSIRCLRYVKTPRGPSSSNGTFIKKENVCHKPIELIENYIVMYNVRVKQDARFIKTNTTSMNI